jgi:DNA polymerase-3 subunit beta
VPVEISEPGTCTVLGDKFFGILSSVPAGGEVEIEQKDTKFTIKAPDIKARWQLKSIASDKFPEFSEASGTFFELPVKDFKEMIQQTVFAVSDDQTRYFINGVYMEKDADRLVMVATDGRRLSFDSKPAPQMEDFAGIIIPPKILNLVLKRAGEEGVIALSVTDKNIYINFAAYKLSSVLIEGTFPNYKPVIPESQSFHFVVERQEMLTALRRVSMMVEQKSHRVFLGVKPGAVSVYSEETELGEGQNEIPCQYDGDEATIALNYRYIEEPFKIMEDKEIAVYFTDTRRAATIKPEPEKDYFHVVMPMQTD